jgi:hypothetical protein
MRFISDRLMSQTALSTVQGHSILRRLLSVGTIITMLLAGASPVRSDPATAMLVLTMAEGVLSMGSNKTDLTFEALKQQTVMIEAIHHRLDAIEATLTTLLTLVNKLPEQMRAALDADRDINRKETLIGWLAVIKGISQDLTEATRDNRKKDVEELRDRLRYRIDDFRATRASLFERSDFVVPSLVLALTAETSALEMLPKIGNEIPRELRAYDDRLAAMLDVSRASSLVAMRIVLEEQQAQHEKDLATVITGTEQSIADGEWPWFSHTLVGTRQVKRTRTTYRTVRGCSDCLTEYTSTYMADEDYLVHTRSWKRSVRKIPLPDAVGSGLFVLELTSVGPTETPGGMEGVAARHRNDNEYEAKFFADHDLAPAIEQFNSRAQAISSLRDLEQIVYAARNLIANWDSGQAERLAEIAGEASKTDARSEIKNVEQQAANEEVRQRQKGMDDARKQAWQDMEEARKEFNAAVEELRKDKWRADILMGIQVAKLSLQAQELGERLELFGSNDAQTSQASKSGEQTPKSDQTPQKQSKAGSSPRNDEASAKIAAAGLSNNQKAEVIIKIIDEVGKSPASKWTTLPAGPTLEETKLNFALTLLDSMGDTYMDTLNKAYDASLADGVSGKMAAAAMSIIATPMGDDTIVDAPSRREYRKRLNELAVPFAKRRTTEILKR